MATIFIHEGTGKRYVLVGTGLGMYRTSRPHRLIGNMGGEETSGTHDCVCGADERGVLHWFESDDLTVLTVDGKTPKEWLAAQDS